MNYFCPESKSVDGKGKFWEITSNTNTAMILMKKVMIYDKLNELFVIRKPFFIDNLIIKLIINNELNK